MELYFFLQEIAQINAIYSYLMNIDTSFMATLFLVLPLPYICCHIPIKSQAIVHVFSLFFRRQLPWLSLMSLLISISEYI